MSSMGRSSGRSQVVLLVRFSRTTHQRISSPIFGILKDGGNRKLCLAICTGARTDNKL